MQLAVMMGDREFLVLDGGGELLDGVKAKDITTRTLQRMAKLAESELMDRDDETWSEQCTIK